MKTIIIPTDFSPSAINAMNYAADMAIAINASVLLFHVYSVPISMTDVPVMLVSVDELGKSARLQMEELTQKLEHVVSGKVPVSYETKLGDTIDELEALCERVQPFAVVMGARGMTGLDALLGSTTLAAVRRIKWPVVCVPIGKEYGAGIHKIGLACDFKDVETTPAGTIKDVTENFSAALHVLNVDRKHENDNGNKETQLLQSMLESSKPVYDFIDHENVEEGISEFAEKNNLDLLIVIPKKHNFWERLFNKSSTKQLVSHSHIPVMCIHEN
ncbi:MAG TPA: universal stress protein [Chitinophagaceae bacterium]|jgi:nucleotide-binding universal stress UspA family protein|nr:universal stress protein [Chitinophagaceae bacterium]